MRRLLLIVLITATVGLVACGGFQPKSIADVQSCLRGETSGVTVELTDAPGGEGGGAIKTSDGGELGAVAEKGTKSEGIDKILFETSYESGSIMVFKDGRPDIQAKFGLDNPPVPNGQEVETLNKCLPGGDWG